MIAHITNEIIKAYENNYITATVTTDLSAAFNKINKLESEIDDLHLKIAEQKHSVDKVNKKLNVLKFFRQVINEVKKRQNVNNTFYIQNQKDVIYKIDAFKQRSICPRM